MIANMLNFNSSDDFYFVQIIKRFKDNPNDDRSRGNYHGGAWYLKGYRIKSTDELLKLKPEIIKMCHDNNARAYITINSRSEKETNDFIKIYRKKYKPTDPRYVYADDIVPGQAKDGPFFNKFDNWQHKGRLATVHPNIDGKIILYSNVQTKGY